MRSLLLVLVVAGACGAAAATRATGPAPRRVGVAHTLASSAVAADTLVTTVRWTLPREDGKGPLDSLTVNVPDLARGGSLRVRLPITAVAVEVRQPIPFRDATWDVLAQVCTWRGQGANQVTCVEARAAFAYAVAAPPPVSAVTVANTRTP